MSRSVRSNLIVLFVIGIALVAVLLLQLPDRPSPTRIDTVPAVPRAVVPAAHLRPAAQAERDRRLFDAWVRAVARRAYEQRVAFLRAARTLHDQPFLACVRAHESDTAGGYRATDGGRNGVENMGAYQFDQSTWNSAARHAGVPHLVGVRPTDVSGFDQDRVAWAWYQHVGPSPWAGSGCY